MTRRTENQLRRLDTLESEFRVALVRHLRARAAGRGGLLFLVSSLRPDDWPPNLRSRVADELFEAAQQILALRVRHGLEAEGGLAPRYIDACRRHVDFDDHQRPGETKQALELLQWIGGRDADGEYRQRLLDAVNADDPGSAVPELER
ncbi:MAG: hypothetical protein KDC38_02440 [Planctomycetes bacterium]|nr:hypothetical protein [Planctomycetota bacterium]